MSDKHTIKLVTWHPNAHGVMLAFGATTRAELKTEDDAIHADEIQKALRAPFRLARTLLSAVSGDVADEEFCTALDEADAWGGDTPPEVRLTPGAWKWMVAHLAAVPSAGHLAGCRRRTQLTIGQAKEVDVEIEG